MENDKSDGKVFKFLRCSSQDPLPSWHPWRARVRIFAARSHIVKHFFPSLYFFWVLKQICFFSSSNYFWRKQKKESGSSSNRKKKLTTTRCRLLWRSWKPLFKYPSTLQLSPLSVSLHLLKKRQKLLFIFFFLQRAVKVGSFLKGCFG